MKRLLGMLALFVGCAFAQDERAASATVELRVRALTVDGKPAAGVPIAVGSPFAPFAEPPVGTTDDHGVFSWVLEGERARSPSVVTAWIACEVLPCAAIDPRELPAEPIVLRLPPCAPLRFILYDEDGRPCPRLESARLAAIPGPLAQASMNLWRTSKTAMAWPTTVEPDSVTFPWVAIGKPVLCLAEVAGIHGALRFLGQASARAGALTVLEGPLADGPATLSFRVVDQEGLAVSSERVGVAMGDEEYGKRFEAVTDAEGRVCVAHNRQYYKRLRVVRRDVGDWTGYRGCGELELVPPVPGRTELGDLTLVDEPVVVRGRVLDPMGQPIEGVRIRCGTLSLLATDGRSAWEDSPTVRPHRWTTCRNAWQEVGSLKPSLFRESEEPLGIFDHCIRTDADGRFELRESGSSGTGLLQLAHPRWQFPQEITVTPGVYLKPICAWPAATVSARIVNDEHRALLRPVPLCAKLRHRGSGTVSLWTLVDGALGPVVVAAGVYDVAVGEFGPWAGIGAFSGVSMGKMKAAAGGTASAFELDAAAWLAQRQFVRVRLRDDSGAPVVGAGVWPVSWRLQREPGPAGLAGAMVTDGTGTVSRPVQMEVDDEGIRRTKVIVGASGFRRRVVDIAEDAIEVEARLLRLRAVTLDIEGMPQLPPWLVERSGFGHLARAPADEAGAGSKPGPWPGHVEVSPGCTAALFLVPGRYRLVFTPELARGRYRSRFRHRMRALLGRPNGGAGIALDFTVGPERMQHRTLVVTAAQRAQREAGVERAAEVFEDERDG